jgi:hypothetical protein
MIGVAHPTPYPEVAEWNFKWIKAHRYWIGYSLARGYPIITNVVYDAADLPRRIAMEDDGVPL